MFLVCRRPTFIPGNATSAALQFLRCCLHQLTPYNIVSELLLYSPDPEMFRILALALTDFHDLTSHAALLTALEVSQAISLTASVISQAIKPRHSGDESGYEPRRSEDKPGFMSLNSAVKLGYEPYACWVSQAACLITLGRGFMGHDSGGSLAACFKSSYRPHCSRQHSFFPTPDSSLCFWQPVDVRPSRQTPGECSSPLLLFVD